MREFILFIKHFRLINNNTSSAKILNSIANRCKREDEISECEQRRLCPQNKHAIIQTIIGPRVASKKLTWIHYLDKIEINKKRVMKTTLVQATMVYTICTPATAICIMNWHHVESGPGRTINYNID